jgi:hypothetical protein
MYMEQGGTMRSLEEIEKELQEAREALSHAEGRPA